MDARVIQTQKLYWEVEALRLRGDIRASLPKLREMARLEQERALELLRKGDPSGWIDLFAAITYWGKSDTLFEARHALALGWYFVERAPVGKANIERELNELTKWLDEVTDRVGKGPLEDLEIRFQYPIFTIQSREPTTGEKCDVYVEADANDCLPLYRTRELAELFRDQSMQVDARSNWLVRDISDVRELKDCLARLPKWVDHVVWDLTSAPAVFAIVDIQELHQRIADSDATKLSLNILQQSDSSQMAARRVKRLVAQWNGEISSTASSSMPVPASPPYACPSPEPPAR